MAKQKKLKWMKAVAISESSLMIILARITKFNLAEIRDHNEFVMNQQSQRIPID